MYFIIYNLEKLNSLIYGKMKMKEIRCIKYVFMCIFNFIYIMLYIILNDEKN